VKPGFSVLGEFRAFVRKTALGDVVITNKN